jgi:hypothetical protein
MMTSAAACPSSYRVGVASGKYIFEQPLQQYWEEQQQQARSRGPTGAAPLQPQKNGGLATPQQQQSQHPVDAAQQAASANSEPD